MATSKQPDATSSKRIQRLEVDREALELAIATCESNRDLPALIREHRAVMAEIEQIAPAQTEVDELDEIAARRASRGSSTSTG